MKCPIHNCEMTGLSGLDCPVCNMGKGQTPQPTTPRPHRTAGERISEQPTTPTPKTDALANRLGMNQDRLYKAVLTHKYFWVMIEHSRHLERRALAAEKQVEEYKGIELECVAKAAQLSRQQEVIRELVCVLRLTNPYAHLEPFDKYDAQVVKALSAAEEILKL